MKKTNWWMWAWIALVILLLIFWKCGGGGGFFSCNKPDTLKVRIDTAYITDTVEKIVSVPQPYQVVKYLPGGTKFDTVQIHHIDPTDTAALMEQCNAVYFYAYEERVKYGKILIEDTLTQNMFIGRGVTFTADSLPVVTKTITLQQPKRIVAYFGLSAFGNKNDLLFGTGADISLKGKNDRIYGVGVTLTKGGQLYYGFQVKFPIKLKK